MGKHQKPDSDAIRIADAKLAEQHERAHEDRDFYARSQALSSVVSMPSTRSRSIDDIVTDAEKAYAFLSGSPQDVATDRGLPGLDDMLKAMGFEVVTGDSLAKEAEEHLKATDHPTENIGHGTPIEDPDPTGEYPDGWKGSPENETTDGSVRQALLGLLDTSPLPDTAMVTVGQVRDHIRRFAAGYSA